MRIAILDGHPQPDAAWLAYLEQLTAALQVGGATVESLPLRTLELRPCTGCFGCWTKTPGACVVRDESAMVCRATINADLVLWASPLIMGFPSALLKRALDKSIPLVHPYFAIVEGEFHHQARYARYPQAALLLAPERSVAPAIGAEAMQITERIFARTALNLKSELLLCACTTRPANEVASALLAAARAPRPQTPHAAPAPVATVGVQVAPPQGLLLFNGSPRGNRGNTPILLEQFAAGFTAASGRPSQTRMLMRLQEMAAHVAAFAAAGQAGAAVMVGFPLYTDSMPSTVKSFFEALAPLAGTPNLPPLAFLIQCGFPETRHLRYVEHYLQHLALRLGAPYLGTLAKGGGEAVRSSPAAQNQGCFDALAALGAGLAQQGGLEPAQLQKLADREAFPPSAERMLKWMVRLRLFNGYFDRQIKQNGAWAQRNAHPYTA